jgi:hypothetical protein
VYGILSCPKGGGVGYNAESLLRVAGTLSREVAQGGKSAIPLWNLFRPTVV